MKRNNIDLIKKSLTEKHLVVFLGSGGVGKTTFSALSALYASEKRKTVVMTVDPAKRLASCLNINSTDKMVKITENLYSIQVDPKRDFKDLAEKIFSKQLSEKITNNRLFRVAVELLPSDEYISFAKLEEVWESDFSLIVLDTPPTTKALSFIDTPSKILNLFNTGAMHQIIRFYELYSKAGRVALKLTGVLRQISKFVGLEFLFEFSEFIFSLKEIFNTMTELSEKAYKILRDSGTDFYIITSPNQNQINEALTLRNELKNRGLNSNFIVNRFYDFSYGIPDSTPEDIKKIYKIFSEVSKIQSKNIEKLCDSSSEVLIIREYPDKPKNMEQLNNLKRKIFGE